MKNGARLALAIVGAAVSGCATGSVASDPDGNSLSVKWWRWKDVDSYLGDVTISSPSSLVTTVQVPEDAVAGQTIQLVLEVTDDGQPPLTRYQRVVVAVTR